MSKINKAIFCGLVGVVILFLADVNCPALIRVTDYPKDILPGKQLN